MKLIFNELWRQCARVIVTDTADVEADTTSAPFNVTTGARHLAWAGSTGERRFLYLNLAGGLSLDALVYAGATAQNGNGLKVMSWGSSYPSTPTTHLTEASFSGPYVGKGAADFVYEFSSAQTNRYAVGLELTGANTKRVTKLYGGTAVSLPYCIQAQFAPIWETAMIQRQPYLVDHVGTFVFQGVSRSTVQRLESLYQSHPEPIFVYDGEGAKIADKLWHCVITGLKIAPAFDDVHVIQIETKRLRHY